MIKKVIFIGNSLKMEQNFQEMGEIMGPKTGLWVKRAQGV
jgi:hypothetical protein